jgi:hypothetical protein
VGRADLSAILLHCTSAVGLGALGQKALDPTIQRASHVTSPRWERRAFGKRCVRFCCPSLLPFVPLVSLGCEHREPAGRVRSKGP